MLNRIILILFLLISSVFSQDLTIESNPLFSKILAEMNNPGSSPSAYLISENYNLHLSLEDLVDQVSWVMRKSKDKLNELKQIYLNPNGVHPQFKRWFKQLKEIATTDHQLKKRLNRQLHFQLYTKDKIALPNDYSYLSLKKLFHQGRLYRIKKYNKIVHDPEGKFLLRQFQQDNRGSNHQGLFPFFTSSLTTTKFKHSKLKKLLKIRRQKYYRNLQKIYKKADPVSYYFITTNGLMAQSLFHQWIHPQIDSFNYYKIFNVISKHPKKYKILNYLSSNGFPLTEVEKVKILTPRQIKDNFSLIDGLLKDFTLKEMISAQTDDYLQSMRLWIADNFQKIETDREVHNAKHSTNQLSIQIPDHLNGKLPRRSWVMENHEALIALYPQVPWIKETPTLLNRNGKRVYLSEGKIERTKQFFIRTAKWIAKPQTYLGLLSGTITMVATAGNLPVAMATGNLIANAAKTKHYDKPIIDFLKSAPKEIVQAVLFAAGFGSGRFFEVIALGTAQASLQALVLGQDVKSAVMVGAALSLLYYYVIPYELNKPISSKGANGKVLLRQNRWLETLETTAKSTIQSVATAALTDQNYERALQNGAIYGFASAQLSVWLLGTRYNPFAGHSDRMVKKAMHREECYQMIQNDLENFKLSRGLIRDANYRTKGVLSRLSGKSFITPGNVSMVGEASTSLSHIMEQATHLWHMRRVGNFEYFLFNYLPAWDFDSRHPLPENTSGKGTANPKLDNPPPSS